MEFDIRSVGFSVAGAHMNIRITPAHRDRAEGLWLRIVSNRDLALLTVRRAGRRVAVRHGARPQSLTLAPRDGRGRIDFAFETPMTLRIRARGLSMRMEVPADTFSCVVQRSSRSWQINHGSGVNLLVSVLRGDVRVDAPWNGTRAEYTRLTLDGENGPCEVALSEFTSTAPAEARRRASLAECGRRAARGYAAFVEGLPEVPSRYRSARELAGYVLWSALVDPGGHYRRPAMLMSKNHMSMVWSWDHCFNAMALAGGHPQLAWDQMLLMFDHQDEQGAIPDALARDRIVWNFCKPPIHGWALTRMMKSAGSAIRRRQLEDFYPKLERWTTWWLRTRDDDGDGICQYNHGNDSGWDNATCFDVGVPIEGPDLGAFLAVQMDTLAGLAQRLGKPRDALRWKSGADRMLRALVRHSWREDRFVAMQSGTHLSADRGDSLIPFVPLVLGRRLPNHISRLLVKGLGEPDRFLTAHGLATESPNSPLYKPDGYWRGPIWAPPTYLIYDGLRRLGEDRLAREVARRFCDTCRMSGMADNFDALTGAPLCDKAYTWTASTFLLLASDLGE